MLMARGLIPPPLRDGPKETQPASRRVIFPTFYRREAPYPFDESVPNHNNGTSKNDAVPTDDPAGTAAPSSANTRSSGRSMNLSSLLALSPLRPKIDERNSETTPTAAKPQEQQFPDALLLQNFMQGAEEEAEANEDDGTATTIPLAWTFSERHYGNMSSPTRQKQVRNPSIAMSPKDSPTAARSVFPRYPDLKKIEHEPAPRASLPSPALQPLPSILRRCKTESVASLQSGGKVVSPPPPDAKRKKPSSWHNLHDVEHRAAPPMEAGRLSRSVSAPTCNKAISFCPQVWIREFCRPSDEQDVVWYTANDMQRFKRDSMLRIAHYEERRAPKLLPTGTGRCVSTGSSNSLPAVSRALFSHRALQVDAPDEDAQDNGKGPDNDGPPSPPLPASPRSRHQLALFKQDALCREIKTVLLVDPHDMLLRLFTKALKSLLPHIQVVTATSSAEAMSRIRDVSFDMMIIEERLKVFHRQHRHGGVCKLPSQGPPPQEVVDSSWSTSSDSSSSTSDHDDHDHASGSALLQRLSRKHARTLLIGVSAHMQDDEARFVASGADLCWGKPPPLMNQDLADRILATLLRKRGQHSLVQELFGQDAS